MTGPSTGVGWIGAGRMGVAMATRLLDAGHDVRVWNRTPGRCGELTDRGAQEVGSVADLSDREVVFSMVTDDAALDDVAERLLGSPQAPRIWVDCSTVSTRASARARARADERSVAYVCAPVSGNPGVVRAGNLIFAVSGPADAQQRLGPLFEAMGRGAHDVGEADEARVVKLCTNLLIAVLAETLSEAVVLGESAGVSRTRLLEFVNDSAVGSPFTRYKSQPLIELDFTPTFTPEGQRKDLLLALALGREAGVSLPVAAATEVAFTRLIGSGLGDGKDFIALVLQLARDAGRTLQPEGTS